MSLVLFYTSLRNGLELLYFVLWHPYTTSCGIRVPILDKISHRVKYLVTAIHTRLCGTACQRTVAPCGTKRIGVGMGQIERPPD